MVVVVVDGAEEREVSVCVDGWIVGSLGVRKKERRKKTGETGP